MKSIITRPIWSTFTYKGNKYKVVEDTDGLCCPSCDFINECKANSPSRSRSAFLKSGPCGRFSRTDKKDVIMKLLLIALLFIPFSLHAQLKPKFAVSYSTADRIRIIEPNGIKSTIHFPSVTFRSGLAYLYKNRFEIFYDQKVWCEASFCKFSPTQFSFEVGANVILTKDIKLSFSHACYHPILTDGVNRSKLYGGCEQITLSYGY